MKIVCNTNLHPPKIILSIRELISAITRQEFQCLKSNKFKTTNRLILKMTNTKFEGFPLEINSN